MSSTVTHLRRCAALACVLSAFLPLGNAAAAIDPATLDLSALTGPAGTQLYVTAPAGTVFDHVHVRVFRADAPDEASLSVNLKDVALENGILTVELREEPVGSTVTVNVQLREPGSQQAIVRKGLTVVRLRPDLVVQSVRGYRPCPSAPDGCAALQVLTTQPVDVVAEVEELNGQTGAAAEATLLLDGSPLATAPLTITPGGAVSVRFDDVALTTAATVQLTVRVGNVLPFETDTSNNAKDTTLEVTEHELVRSTVLVPFLGGYGAQFNQHVYAPVSNPPVGTLPDFEAKVKAFEPQLVRIFYNDNLEERQPNAPKNLASFKRVVCLAHEAGATINVTYQAVDVAKLDPVGSMTRFAVALEDVINGRGCNSVRWVTVANEPNSTQLTMPEYDALYRALDDQLTLRGLRPHIRFMGGDLVQTNQRLWFQWIAENMNDILDAYSVHIYWSYWDPSFAEARLKDVRLIVTEELPEAARKPTYITEFGARGIINMTGKPALQPGYWADGTEMGRTNIAAFQQLWFDLTAAQLGFTGSVKWDAYWGKYDANYNQRWYLIGPAAEGWPLFPSYHALGLLLQTTRAGWQVLQVAPWAEDDWKKGVADTPERELAAYADGTESLTVMGLDTAGRDLNAASEVQREYSVGGLPANTNFTLVVWNGSGDGTNSNAGTVPTNAVGVARFTVPLHAAFSLTTLPVS